MTSLVALPTAPAAASASTLPPELWLEIIPHVPYSPTTLTVLRLVSTDLNTLIQTHEISLVSAIKAAQSNLAVAKFPGLKVDSYKTLATLSSRNILLARLDIQWPTILTHGTQTEPEFRWLQGRYTSLHRAGLLLLYRLQDCGSNTHEDKISLLATLPATSLACLLLTLISSIEILRVFGPEPICARYCKGQMEVRCEVELAFEECMLEHGPEFFMALLDRGLLGRCTSHDNNDGGDTVGMKGGADCWAVTILTTELSQMTSRQLPNPNGSPKPPTLIASLRRALAGKTDVPISQTVSKMWEIVSGTGFDCVDDIIVEKLVRGELLEEGGKRRMGF